MRDIDFEEGFLDGLAGMGELGYLGKTLTKKTKAECLRDGGAWEGATKTCIEGGRVPAPAQPTRAEKRQDAQADRAAAQAVRQKQAQTDQAAAQAARQAQAVANRKAACTKQGGFWDVGRGVCVPASKTAKPVQTPSAPAAAPQSLEPQTKAACRVAGGTWLVASKTCLIGGTPAGPGPLATQPAAPATNKAACVAGGGQWFPGVRKCMTAADLAACKAQGGNAVRGACKVPSAQAIPGATTTPSAPGRPGKTGNKAVCEASGGRWFPGAKICMTAEELAACMAQGGTAVRGACKVPGVVAPVRPITGAGTPAAITATTVWNQVNRYINCLTRRRGGAPVVCQPPTQAQFRGPGWAEYFACLLQSIAGKTDQACVAPSAGAPIAGTPICPAGSAWSAAQGACVATGVAQLPAVPPTQVYSDAQQWYLPPAAPGTALTSTSGAASGQIDPNTGLLVGGGTGGAAGGAGGGGEAYLSPEGVPGTDQASAAVQAGMVAGGGSECSEGFNATLPQEYNDEFGKMVVLQVYCKTSQAQAQGAAQQPDAFTAYADTSQASAITGSFGPMGTKPISAVEAEEMGAGQSAGAGAGAGMTGFGW